MKQPIRLGHLDGLRGLMCVWVVIGHACGFTGLRSLPVLRSPHYAVDGFMILSGFLMTLHYLLRQDREPWTKPSTWAAFYIRRFFRISPLYYALLIPSYLFLDKYSYWRLTLDRTFNPTLPVPQIPPFSLINVLSHVSFLFGLLPRYHSSLIVPDWSLSLEMQFYLMFPFLMLFVLRFGWVAFSLVGSGVWLLASHSGMAQLFTQNSPLPLSLVWFVIGMLWANAYLMIESSPTKATVSALFAGGLSIISRDPHDVLLVAFFGWVLFANHPWAGGRCASYARHKLSGRVSAFLADASYSVYLIHLLILTPIAYLLYARTHLSASSRCAITFLATAAISYGLAKPMEIIEKLGIGWGRKLSAAVLLQTTHPPAIPAVQQIVNSRQGNMIAETVHTDAPIPEMTGR